MNSVYIILFLVTFGYLVWSFSEALGISKEEQKELDAWEYKYSTLKAMYNRRAITDDEFKKEIVTLSNELDQIEKRYDIWMSKIIRHFQHEQLTKI